MNQISNKRSVRLYLCVTCTLLMLIQTPALYAQLSNIAINDLRASVNDRIVLLDWIPQSVSEANYTLLRRNSPFTQQNIRNSEIIANVPTTVTKVADIVPTTGRYYYSLIPTNVFNSSEVITIGDELHTKTPAIVSRISTATQDSVIVTNIRRRLIDDTIQIDFSARNDFSDLYLFRSQRPIANQRDLRQATPVQSFKSNTRSVLDRPPSGSRWYYSIQDKALYDNNLALVLVGVNTTSGVELSSQNPPIVELPQAPSTEPEIAPNSMDELVARLVDALENRQPAPQEQPLLQSVPPTIVEQPPITVVTPTLPPRDEDLSSDEIIERVIGVLAIRGLLDQGNEASSSLSDIALARLALEQNSPSNESREPRASEEEIITRVINSMVARGILQQDNSNEDRNRTIVPEISEEPNIPPAPTPEIRTVPQIIQIPVASSNDTLIDQVLGILIARGLLLPESVQTQVVEEASPKEELELEALLEIYRQNFMRSGLDSAPESSSLSDSSVIGDHLYFVSEEDLAPSLFAFKNILASILREDFLQGNYGNSIKRIQDLLIASNNEPDEHLARAYFYLGQSYLGQRQYNDALAAFLSARGDRGIAIYNDLYIDKLLIQNSAN